MQKYLLTVAAALLTVASAQTTTPTKPAPTPTQAQQAVQKSANNLAKYQKKTTNNMSRYQRTECIRLHGKIVKNAKGQLVCVKPKK